jgi:hypothetical protein
MIEHGDEFAGDLLVGAAAIRDFLIHLGLPVDVDQIYYLKRTGWPIGNTSISPGPKRRTGGLLIASKRRLIAHTQKLAAT